MRGLNQMQTKDIPRQYTSNDDNADLVVELFGTNLFGPQSKWSSLLGRREHLQHEIKRGKKYLEQHRKDLAECRAFLQAWRADEEEGANRWVPNLAQQASASDAMEQIILNWLGQLEENLGAVTKEIESFEAEGGVEPFDPEESMFELLRAAG